MLGWARLGYAPVCLLCCLGWAMLGNALLNSASPALLRCAMHDYAVPHLAPLGLLGSAPLRLALLG